MRLLGVTSAWVEHKMHTGQLGICVTIIAAITVTDCGATILFYTALALQVF